MAEFTALRHTWDFEGSEVFGELNYFRPKDTNALNPANADCMSICYNGTYFFIVDFSDRIVYTYNAAWTLLEIDPLHANNAEPRGICWDGTSFWVLDNIDNRAYEYNTAWVLQGSEALHANNTNCVGLCWDGTYFYVTEISRSSIFKYTSAWVYVSETSTSPFYRDLDWDGTYFYALVFASATISKLDASFNQLGYWRSHDDHSTNPRSFCNDGTDIFLIDDDNNEVLTLDLDAIEWEKNALSGHNTIITINNYQFDPFTAQITGNVEAWIIAKDANISTGFILKDASLNECIHIEILTNKIYGDGVEASNASDYKWYLLRVNFNCTTNTYDLWINGTKELDGQAFGVNDDGGGLTSYEMKTAVHGNGYIDALGFDWDAGYTQGDNATDIVDVTSNIIHIKITEELGIDSFADLDVKGVLADFEAGHNIDFYDSDVVLSWTGIILFPESVLVGTETVGKMRLLGLDSKFNSTYRKNFTTARDSDYILKNIIDNSLTRYHSYDDEIDNFTITYKYDLKTRIRKVANYLAMLERAVVHYKPDGEIFFNKYDNLSATGLSWTQATSNVKITRYTPIANRHVTRAAVIGANNDLGQVYYVGRALESEENQFGINELQPWRDPEITNYSEAKQVGDNLQIIYSLDTQMISMLVVQKKHIQVGYTVQLSWNILFNVALANFLVTKRVWYPITDICELELTDNILTRKAFNLRVINKFYDEDAQSGYDHPDIVESTVDGVVEVLHSLAKLRHPTTLDAIVAAKVTAAYITNLVINGSVYGAGWSGSITATTQDKLYDKFESIPPIIHQILMTGINGFVKSDRYGAVYSVAFSDVNAGVISTFYVANGGSFKVSIMHSGTGNNFGKTAGGLINISYDVAGGLESWNIGGDFNLPLEDLRYLKIPQFGTAFTVANNSKIGIIWTKDDNAGGAGGVFSIYGMFLTRQ